jgi:nitrite reductase (NADH) small subunit
VTQAHVVASVADLPEGHHLVVEVHGRQIGVFNVHGRYYALPNVCFHQSGPLCQGAVSGTVIANASTGWQRTWASDGEIIVCPWHSLEFEIATGQCLAYPKRRLPTYSVQVDGDRLVILL